MHTQLNLRRLIQIIVLGFALLGPIGVDAPARAQEDPGPKVIYLTFDDGPSGYTQAILDLLAQHNAKATFFVVGRNAAGREDLLHAMYAAGHGVANHTYNHPMLTAVGKERFNNEVVGTARVLGDLDHGCLRPPYGAQSKTVRAEASELGYTVVMWTIDPRDWARPGAAAIASAVIKRAYPGAIVVLHDGGGDRTQTVAALGTILSTLEGQGYTFGALCREGAPQLPPASPGPIRTQGGGAGDSGGQTESKPERASVGGITAPKADAKVSGVVSILGSADHPTFRKWQLDLLIDGQNETFLAVGEERFPSAGELMVWDTTKYPNGKHVLRLRVVYEGLNYDEYFSPVEIANP